MDLIYKIAPASLWRKAQDKGRFDGAPADIADGYVHFSTAEQVEANAAKYFSGTGDLLLIAVDTKRLGDGLRFEPSHGGMLFPHLYGDLPLDAVVWAKSLPLRPDCKHDFAGLLGITDEPEPD
ncbi:MAG: DUF952 domain-containing protein [Methylocella sp.]|nr:MAG: DUF952 domain-containing protein [Hyphomicrobiales bacterium]